MAWRKGGVLSAVKSKLAPAGLEPRSILTGPFRGIRMDLDLQKDSQIYAGLYEREIFSSIPRLSKGIRTMVDIGAAQGEFTLHALLKTRAERVICFEPDQKMVGRLRRNLQLNGLEHDPRLQFHAKFLTSTDGPEQIAASSLAEWIQTPCFIKMDIECGEVEVLRAAAPRLLAKPGLRWLIETHTFALRDECQAILGGAGYRIRYISQAWWRAIVPELRATDVGWLIATND